MRVTGIVKWFNHSKGFGFITAPGGEEIFVHFSAMPENTPRTLKTGEKVSFEIHTDRRGTRQAANVVVG